MERIPSKGRYMLFATEAEYAEAERERKVKLWIKTHVNIKKLIAQNK